MPFNVFNSVARLQKKSGVSESVANWVAVGDGELISKSSDGNTWTSCSVSGITYGRGVAYGKDETGAGLWVAVGQGGLIAKSSDGNTWTQAASVTGITTFGFGVAFKNEIV